MAGVRNANDQDPGNRRHPPAQRQQADAPHRPADRLLAEAAMRSHPNRSNYRYFKVSPRGFANEVTYYRVPLDKIAECEAAYENYEDNGSGRYASWTNDADARRPGVAIDWADRNY